VILVDTNVWVDVLNRDPVWHSWSFQALKQARDSAGLAVNPIIYAELCAHTTPSSLIDEFLNDLNAAYTPLSKAAASLAGQAFWVYRARKGNKTGVLPDFLIGAHAQADNLTLLTRDGTRYKTYFPKVKLICPTSP
jgi:predicted nucleic acid-binding protein